MWQKVYIISKLRSEASLYCWLDTGGLASPLRACRSCGNIPLADRRVMEISDSGRNDGKKNDDNENETKLAANG